MQLAPIVARLQAQCPMLRIVQPALSATIPTAYPAAFVVQLAESVLDSTHDNARYVFEARFAVEISVKQSATATTGGAAQVDLDAVRESVIDALAGYRISPAHGPIAYDGGKLVEFEPGFATWRDEFIVHFTR